MNSLVLGRRTDRFYLPSMIIAAHMFRAPEKSNGSA